MKQKKNQGPWIHAYNSTANQKVTYPMNIDLVDVDARGENLLVIAEFNQLLSFFKGENLNWQERLNGVPAAVSHFYCKDPRTNSKGFTPFRLLKVPIHLGKGRKTSSDLLTDLA